MTQPKIDHLEAVPGHPESIVPATIGGVACYAFKLQSGWVQPWDSGNIGGNGKPNERAEISYAPAQGTLKVQSPYNVREGMKQTYDVDYRFAAGFPPHNAANHEWAVLTQFHPQDDSKGPKGFGGATVHDGAITFDHPTVDGQYIARIPIKPDTWFRIRMAVNWSSGKDGYAKIVDRATGTLLGRYDGQTIAAGEFKYLKQGYYRAGGLPDGTVYQSSPGGALIDITSGDLTETATTTPPPAQGATTATVQAYAAQLLKTRDALRSEADAINALLSKP